MLHFSSKHIGDWSISHMGRGVYHIVMPTQMCMTTTFCRSQEYAESCQFKNVLMSKSDIIKFYKKLGAGSYFTTVAGMNIPGRAFLPIIKDYMPNMTWREKDAATVIKMLHAIYGENFYVIITYKNDSHNVLEHEICHALYYVNEDYRNEVNEQVDKFWRKKSLEPLKEFLAGEAAYHVSVRKDECHAYMSADYKETCERLKCVLPKELHEALREIRSRYKLENE